MQNLKRRKVEASMAADSIEKATFNFYWVNKDSLLY